MEPQQPSGPVQTFPQGLLGFLNLKNVGRYPSVMRDDYQPTLDLSTWLLETQAEETVPLAYQRTHGAGNPVGFFGYTTPLVVPAQEFWYVSRYNVGAQSGAGDAAVYAPAWRIGATDFNYYGFRDYASMTSNMQLLLATETAFLPPGTELGYHLRDSTSAGTLLFVASLRFARLRI